jgi:hypothetical protein
MFLIDGPYKQSNESIEVANEVVLDAESHYCLEMISESSATKKQKTFVLKFCLLLKMDGK